MLMGGVRVMKSYFLTNFSVECLRMKVQVVFNIGSVLSWRNDVPGSCSTLSNALARSDDMSSSFDPDSCSLRIGDSSGDGIASLAGCITCGGDVELSSSLEIVVASSLRRSCSLGSVTCWRVEFLGSDSTVGNMSLSLIAGRRSSLLRGKVSLGSCW